MSLRLVVLAWEASSWRTANSRLRLCGMVVVRVKFRDGQGAEVSSEGGRRVDVGQISERRTPCLGEGHAASGLELGEEAILGRKCG